MSYIEAYTEHLKRIGATGRDRQINMIKRDLSRLAPDSAAYKTIVVNGKEQKVIMRSTDNYYTKELICMPDENVPLGSYVDFVNAKWIVHERDFDDEVYGKSRMRMCNSVLKWKAKDGTVYSYKGYADDATKYSEGTEGTRYLRVGEFQLKIIIPVDEITSCITRDMRFLIDADKYIPSIVAAGDTPYAFRVTRRNIVTGVYRDEGYVEITLVEDSFINGKDDAENMIAVQQWELKETENADTSSEEEGAWI